MNKRKKENRPPEIFVQKQARNLLPSIFSPIFPVLLSPHRVHPPVPIIPSNTTPPTRPRHPARRVPHAALLGGARPTMRLNSHAMVVL